MNEKELLKYFIACMFKNVFGPFGGLTKPSALKGGWGVVGFGRLRRAMQTLWESTGVLNSEMASMTNCGQVKTALVPFQTQTRASSLRLHSSILRHSSCTTGGWLMIHSVAPLH